MKALYTSVLVVMMLAALAACGSGKPEPKPTSEPTQAPASTEATALPAVEAGPAVGGSLVIAYSGEPDSLDVHRSSAVSPIMKHVGASLIAKDPATGDFVPYLATEWSVSQDGLTYEFKLRDDVKFHDGTPLTAQDYAWTLNRAVQQQPMSTAGGSLQNFKSAEAVDDYTLRINMAMPNSALLDTLALSTWHQPLSQAYVEKMGDGYGRAPMGVGPYRFKEWVTGEKIVLERNPDFTWGPAFTHGGPAYIETIEFRMLPEYATQMAGLEAGEVDFMALETKDAQRLRDAGSVTIFDTTEKGGGTLLLMNTAKPPFDDVKVRQAINQAIDRDVLVQVIGLGESSPSYGPITPATVGYWPGVEEIGYKFDLEAAKGLMAEAGYTANADGVLEKDGQPLAVTLQTFPVPDWIKAAEIVQQQLKALGVETEIQQQEPGVAVANLTSGNYQLGLTTPGWPDYGLLFAMYHPATLGAFNYSQVNDPELSPLLEMMSGAPVREVVMQAAADAQKRIVEQAYIAPLYASRLFYALQPDVKDALFSEVEDILLYDAYIEP